MSRKTPITDISEDNVDTSAPIRRSSRISLSQNPVSSPAPKSVVTRRNSASSISDKNKPINGDADTSPPGKEKRKSRRASTEEDIKPTPIKTRRSSVSKIIEEEKKVLSTPNTPTRKSTRAISTSPTTADVSTRRTRRSMSASQENDVVEEQLSVRRSTRRRSSVDTQEDITNDETPGKTKPSTRRRRSTSVDEKEESNKNDMKQKTKKLYSEDNQLEPIEEQETETAGKSRDIAEIPTKKSLDLSVIEETDDTEVEESKKVINDIDDLLKNDVSPPISVKQGIIRSIFSPVTPRIYTASEQKTMVGTKDQSSDMEGNEKNKIIVNKSEKLKSSSDDKSKKELIVNEVHSESELDENCSSPSSTRNVLPSTKSLDKEAKSSEGKTEKILNIPVNSRGISITDKAYLSTGSDDSFTLHLNMSLDKTQFPEAQTDEDVFSSPGSNKENSSINIPRKSESGKNEDHAGLTENIAKEIYAQDAEVNVFASKKATRDSFVEPMDIDCDLETENSNKINTPKVTKKASKMISPEKSKLKKLDEQNQDSPIIQKVTEDDETSNGKDTIENRETANVSLCEKPKKIDIGGNEKSLSQTEESEDDGESKKLESTNTTMTSNFGTDSSFIHINSFQSDNDKMDSSFDMLKISSTLKKSVSVEKEKESDDDTSSDISIRIVDTDEENQHVKDDKSAVNEKTLQSNSSQISETSKRARISDGTSSKVLQQPSLTKEKDSILEVETSVREDLNNSTKEESEAKEDAEKTSNKDDEELKKMIDEKASLESSTAKSSSSHSALQEHKPLEDKNLEKASPRRKSSVKSLENNDEGPSLNVKEHEIDDKSPRKSSRISLRKNAEKVEKGFDGGEQNSDVKDNKGEDKSSEGKTPHLSSKLKSHKDEESEKDFGGEETKCIDENESLKNCNTDSVDKENSEDEQEQIESRLINSERKSRSCQSLNEKFDEEDDETEMNEREQTPSIENRKESTILSLGKKSNSCQSLKDESMGQENEPENTNEKEQEQIKNMRKPRISSETKSEHATKTKNENRNEQKKIANTKCLESSDEEISTSKSKKVKKTNTDAKLEESESIKSDESSQKYSEEKAENPKIMNTKNTLFKKGETENLDRSECSNSDDFVAEIDSTTNNSYQKLSKDSQIANKKSKKYNSPTRDAVSPLKTKMEKMKACGVNFVNPTPTKSRIKLDDETSAKIDNFLSKKLGIPQNKENYPQDETNNEENDSEDENGSMSEDYETKSGFLDDMAEEGEEDTPSEGSNDIIDEGESINSTESEVDSDETYDSNDSFLVKDDGEDLELLSGEEYDLEVSEEYEKVEQKPKRIIPRRKRIIQNENLTSDEESAVRSPRVSFSEKVEVIHKKKGETPAKKNTDVLNKNFSSDFTQNEKCSKETSTNLQTKVSPRRVESGDIPSIQVDLIEDSSDDEEETKEIGSTKIENIAGEKSAFEERIRSLVEGEKSSTPNNSFNEAPNTSRHNTSARSSSIIVHENVSINEIKDGFLAEKLQQVVNVFCAGIRTSDGNISMNVSLDYVENSPKTSASDNKTKDDVVICIEDEESLSETEKRSPRKGKRSSSRSEDNKNDSLSHQGNLKKRRRSSNVFTQETTKDTCPKMDNLEESINTEDLSLLDASLSEESYVQDQNRTINSEDKKKKRRSSGRIERRLSNNKKDEECSSSFKNKYTENATKEQSRNIIQDTPIWTEEIQPSNSSKKKQRSSLKMEKQNESTEYNYKSPATKIYREKSLEEDKPPKQKLKENSENEESFRKLVRNETAKNKKNKSQSNEDISEAAEEPQVNYSEYEKNLRVVENTSVTDQENEQVKKNKKKANKKRKHAEGIASEPVPELMASKRMKLLNMACEELAADDLRYRLPSRNELSDEPQTRIKSKKLKRLQSKLKSDLKNTLVSGLVTDVKNRPRRIMKPSVQMEEGGCWLVEEHRSKPSAANVAKCTFNFKKIDSKDFKNQMLFDPRIKREQTSTFLRKKRYFV